MTLQWVSADLLTGRVIADLPSLDMQWPIRRTISNYDSATGTLHLDGAPENWERAIQDGAALLFAYDDTDAAQPIVWCGYVTGAELDAGSDDVPVSVATFEAVLDRAYVGDVTYTTGQGRNDIIADLITSWFTPQTGIPLGLQYTPGGPTPAANIVWQNTDNATVKARLDQVCGQLGGEYTVEWAWSDDNQSITPTLRFGDRIGVAALPGADPPVTFEMPGVLINFKQGRDYSAGAGANKITAYSSGQGSTTPYAAPVYGPADGRPVLEYRYQPAPSLSPAALTQYAQQAVQILAPGKRPVTLVAATARMNGRRLGADWALGDDIGYRVSSPFTNEQGDTVVIKAFPTGVSGVGRAIAYELTDTTVSPILADAAVYTDSGA